MIHFNKVLNASLGHAHGGAWGITRGVKPHGVHIAVEVTVPKTGVVAVHNMLSVKASDMVFAQFLKTLTSTYRLHSAAMTSQDPSTMGFLRQAGVAPLRPDTLAQSEADLLVPAGVTRADVEPWFRLIATAAEVTMEGDQGVTYL